MSKKVRVPVILVPAAATVESFTEIRRQEALLKTGALQSAIFNSSNFSSIATDAKGVIQIFNVGAERMLGYAAADVINKITPADISDPQELIARAAALSVELSTPITSGFEALVFKASRGIEDIYELTYIRKDGSRFPAVVSVTALRDAQNTIIGYLLIGTDNTARKRVEAERSVSETRYRRLFESAKDGILILDAQSAKITDANPYMAELLGYSHTELIGRELCELGLFKDVEASQAAMRELQEKHFIRYEDLALKTKAGQRIDVEFVSNVYSEGNHRVIQCNIRDITDRHRAAKHLADEDRRKDEFMAILAHELRNPLTPIKTSAQLISAAKVDNPIIIRAQEIIERQANHMIRLVDDLLDIARLQNGKVRLKKEILNLSKVVSDAVDFCSHLMTSQNHQINLNLQGKPPLFIEADPSRVVQIVANIVGNAAKYTPNNGVIQVTAAAEKGMAVIRVRDNGAGIDSEMLGRIFDVYAQVEQSLDRSQGGLGLGLKLVKELVLLHGGTVEAFSEGLGKGSEFVVRIPLARAPDSCADIPAKQPGTCGIFRHVLLIEDSADTRESMELLLRMSGHRTDLAEDGFQGVDKALTLLPDVALIDIGLPVLNGYEVAKAIRAGKGGDKIVLIALTGYGQAEDKQRAFEAGFDDHMTKPADAVDLFMLLNDLEKYNRVGV